MCLYIKWYSIKRIALKDIECFKVVYKDAQLIDIFRTKFQNSIVRIGETYTSEIKKHEKINCIDKALHSFIKQIGAEDILRNDEIIVKCIIPKGSRYYIGKWEYNIKSYASNKIKYIEIIN